jgi:hypothetical protein
VQVIAHHRVGENADGKHFRKSKQPFFDPLHAVLEAATGEFILAAEERATNAARDAVLEARRSGINQLAAGRCHGGGMATLARRVCQWVARSVVGNLQFDACPGPRLFDTGPGPRCGHFRSSMHDLNALIQHCLSIRE